MRYYANSLILFLFSIQFSHAQTPRDIVSVFVKQLNIEKYAGGEFVFSADVKADTMTSNSSSHLWVRIDDRKDNTVFFNNMYKKPIQSNVWKNYSIKGKIDKKSKDILFGGICLNKGKYYFDNFDLKIKMKGGEWETIALPNARLEDTTYDNNWGTFNLPKDCKFEIHKEKDNNCLIIDASQLSIYGYNKKNGKFADVNGVKLYYETYGEGEPLLLIHGNSQSIKSYAAQIPVLAKKYKVIAVDTRGHGQSTEDGTSFSYTLFADDMIALIEHLNLKKVNVLGWSDGGNTGLIMAMKAPQKINKLAVMGACLFNDETSIKPEINKQLKKLIRQLEKQTNEITFQKRMMYLLRDEPNINPNDLQKITCPTLIMAGENDYFFESHTRLIAEKIKNDQLIIFKGGNHMEPSTNPERFNTTVISFFLDENNTNNKNVN
ncbi:alpha/beta fold hydrolase [Flammeovirga kamogawensis]|uniref:Alpha/beta hydrolase n=1 Tax=Flammeovirga kamogawensis TaxID=373891 RepID=A0ABX8H3A0_9BACT|nr:alpha/beta hydrolase [Flammeovirga kamogawensis]MBB6462635.1 pimeloyl-ACP methyl ester carboxylesterase [Flammeovirga kamogawensis]QWG09620.1 alpha/beta hydrolase [Flammeovirga kamogawensis]TRX65134.1 alpha/beta hydrolase [Flammeovirga kamogawensis]